MRILQTIIFTVFFVVFYPLSRFVWSSEGRSWKDRRLI